MTNFEYINNIKKKLLPLSGHCKSFNEILLQQLGVPPLVIRQVIKEMYAERVISSTVYAEWMQCVSVMQKKQKIFSIVPHFLDFDWRFTEETAQRLLYEIRKLTPEKITFLGTPTLYEYCDANMKKYSCLFDINGDVYLEAEKVDVRNNGIINDADVFVLDPPWFTRYYMLFMCNIIPVCKPGNYIFCVWPPELIRPTMEDELNEFKSFISDNGFEIVDFKSLRLYYHTPLFEAKTFAVNGIESFPENWHFGELMILRKTNNIVSLPVGITAEEDIYDEFTFGYCRIKIKINPVGSYNSQVILEHLYPNDIYPTISSREILPEIKIWTSSNRVFGCNNPEKLRKILSLCKDNSNNECCISEEFIRFWICEKGTYETLKFLSAVIDRENMEIADYYDII